MKKTQVKTDEIKLMGLKIRTNNQKEFNPETAQIESCVMRYFTEGWNNKIPHLKNPNTTRCAYTEYESDDKGDYTFFVGAEVSAVDRIPEGLDFLAIPAQTYIKFTTESGPMPDVVIEAWQKIWKMSPDELGGTRSFKADFEVYDERAQSRQNTILDIYIGVNAEI